MARSATPARGRLQPTVGIFDPGAERSDVQAGGRQAAPHRQRVVEAVTPLPQDTIGWADP